MRERCLISPTDGPAVKCLFDCKNICQRIGVKGTKPFPPETANMAAWFRFGQGITSAAGLVSQWDDQSVNGRHLKQGTDTNRPGLQADGSILFDGVDNFMECDPFTLNQPSIVYLLGKQVTWTSGDTIFDGEVAQELRFVQSAVTPDVRLRTGATTSGPSSAWAVDTYAAVATLFNGAASVIQINNNATTVNAGTGNATGFQLGALVGPSSFANIQVKEVIIYAAAHDSDKRAAIISYLARVGGLSL